jgi:flagellar biosynthesis protein FliR
MTITILPEVTVLYLLTFARLGTMMMLMPGLGEDNIAMRMRLALALGITLIVYPIAAPLYPRDLLANVPKLILFMVGEIAIGVFVGLTARLVLAASQIAGTTIANQMGLGFAMAVDPAQGQQGALIGNFLNLMAITMIFVMDLHHLAIRGMNDSFQLFPPGDLMPIGDFAKAGTDFIADAFRIGVLVSAPFLVFGIVFNFGVGLLQKLMPQFQVFFIAMPASILFGFVLLFLLLGTLMTFYMDHVSDVLGRLIAR